MNKAETYLESCQASKMRRFAKIVNRWKLLTLYVKRFVLHVSQGSDYASDVLCDHSVENWVKLLLLVKENEDLSKKKSLYFF